MLVHQEAFDAFVSFHQILLVGWNRLSRHPPILNACPKTSYSTLTVEWVLDLQYSKKNQGMGSSYAYVTSWRMLALSLAPIFNVQLQVAVDGCTNLRIIICVYCSFWHVIQFMHAVLRSLTSAARERIPFVLCPMRPIFRYGCVREIVKWPALCVGKEKSDTPTSLNFWNDRPAGWPALLCRVVVCAHTHTHNQQWVHLAFWCSCCCC